MISQEKAVKKEKDNSPKWKKTQIEIGTKKKEKLRYKSAEKSTKRD